MSAILTPQEVAEIRAAGWAMLTTDDLNRLCDTIDALREKSRLAEINAAAWESTARMLGTPSKSPFCDHTTDVSYTNDGGKSIRCLLCSEEALRGEVERLKAERDVRSFNYGFPSRPEKHRHTGASSAYDSGYEAGWRGWSFRNPYTRIDCAAAFNEGYQVGQSESADEIQRCLSPEPDGGAR